MAEMNLTASQSGRALRVDLTPMVDLGFLLISFFMFTTTLTTPQAMRLTMPDKAVPVDSPTTAAAATLTLRPSADGVRYVEGVGPSRQAFLNHAPSVRDEILRFQERLSHDSRFTKNDMVVLIQPGDEASYGSLIGVLDEMLICGVKRYMIVPGDSVSPH